MTDMTFPGSLASLFNRHHLVGKDLAIDPDPELHSYQDDIDHSNTAQQPTIQTAINADTDDEDDDLTDHDE